MNSLVKTLVLGVALLGGALYAFDAHNKQVAKLDLDYQRAHLRAAYVERMSFAYALPQTDRYRDELASATRWYFAELADLYNKHPGAARDAEEPRPDAKAKPAAKGDAAADRKEFVELTRGFFEKLKSGKYDPNYSSPLLGVRVDLFSLRRETYEGKSRVRVEAVVWGAPRRETITKAEPGKPASGKMNLDFLFKKLSLEFVDAKQKLVGGGETGAPVYFIDYPERFVPDFPPQAALAVWYVDPLPHEAAVVTLRVDGEIRSPAGVPLPITVTQAFPPMEELKLRADEKFDGEERTMTEEEMDRSKK